MLRINLLPPSVNQRRLNKRLYAGFAVLLALCIVLPILYGLKLSHDLTVQQNAADTAKQDKAVTDALNQKATATTAQIQPIQDKVDFVTAVHKYHMAQVRIYYTLAQYTDSKVIYSDATYAGTTMTVHAYTPSLGEVGRYLQRMYHNIQVDTGPNAVFSSVSIDHVPGYPDGYVNKYYVGNTLVAVGSPPAGVSAPGSSLTPGQNTNAPGASSFPRPGGSFPSGGGALGGRPPTLTSGLGGAQAGAQSSRAPSDAYTEPITPIETLLRKQMNPLAVPRQQEEFKQQLLHSVRTKRVAQGFDFTATLTLANPPVAPVVPGSTGGTTGGGLGGARIPGAPIGLPPAPGRSG